MEQEVVVKSEMNGELLVLFVDENGSQEEGVITTIQNIEGASLEDLQQGNFFIEEVGDQQNEEQELTNEPAASENQNTSRWTDDDTRRLLVFYIDNKDAFINGNTSKKQLWQIACKTMLIGKTSASCEMKLRNLKRNYSMIRIDQIKGKSVFIWPYYDLCHQAFQDDSYVNTLLNDALYNSAPVETNVERKTNEKKGDEKVEQMLNLYLKYKKMHVDVRKRQVWEKIVQELGEDAEYWNKRFLNFKQHYIANLEKRQTSGPKSVNWPYMNIFDQIFENDTEFQKKYGQGNKPVRILSDSTTIQPDTTIQPLQYIEWDETEKTVLVKYCFDCFDEFQDPTIPNTFLWHEIGRLLDKIPDKCKKKYEELKTAHLDHYLSGCYDIRSRIPIAILFDNIIAKEVEIEFSKFQGKANELEEWTMEEIDALVQFFYDKLEMFKDPICHFVCWAAVSKTLGRTIKSCKAEWDDLTSLYKTILEDKKEDPDIEIDWRYIELFERIFDYGMDTKLLEGYYINPNTKKKTEEAAKVKKVNIKMEEVLDADDIEVDDEKNVMKRSLGKGDEKSFKILDYYLKYKDKFATKKKGQWDALAKEIGVSAEQCAHRFRNLKQVYTSYIQREIYKPEVPILWPYYHLCKKVFGYRQIKNKLKNSSQCEECDDWTPREIKKVISHFAKNFNEIDNNMDNKELWKECAEEINKTVNSCREKFLELRKSYRKVKTVLNNNPDCKVNWKYYKLFEEIYSGNNVEAMAMEVDSEGDSMDTAEVNKNEDIDDDDYQCIIVLPEGQEIPSQESISQLPNTQIIITDNSQALPEKTINRGLWKITDKKKLLETYLDYIKRHKGKIINTKDMWREIAKEFPNKNYKSCHLVFHKMKANYKRRKDVQEYRKTKIYALFKEIEGIKTKFYRPHFNLAENVLKDPNLCENVDMLEWKVELALKYYLDNLEEFILPNYSIEHAWKEFGKMICVPLRKLVKKINYLKNFYNSETDEVDGQKFPFGHLIKEILQKELALRIGMATAPEPSNTEEKDGNWSDEDIHTLLAWYLENLQRFKNPKYIKSYLWMEAAKKVGKSAVSCSEKMSEIRSQYSSMVKANPQILESWKFSNLCQKIYGTGKRNVRKNKNIAPKTDFHETTEAFDETSELQDETSEETQNETSEETQNETSEEIQNETSEETQNETSEEIQNETSEETQNETSEEVANDSTEVREAEVATKDYSEAAKYEVSVIMSEDSELNTDAPSES